MEDTTTDPPSASESESRALEDLVAQALAALDGPDGERLEHLLGQHPRQAEQVRSHVELALRLGLVGSQADPTPPPERLDDFRILETLGQGSMGVVYRALQESLDREVGLKIVRPDQLYFPAARARFQREVEIVARLAHPGIVPVYAVGNANSVPYFAMELVHGATLAEVLGALQERRPSELTGADLDAALARHLGEAPTAEPAPLFRGPWSEVVPRILREVAEALEHAHRRGVLHRDVKPSNIMVTRAGRVLLLDFGLADASGQERLTRVGSQIGSLAYMAPELLTSEPRELEAHADVYALGVTGWELLTLRLPYASSNPLRVRELAAAAERPRVASLNPRVGWELETVLAKALEPDPERRYASAALFARDLDNLLAHRPIEARQAGLPLRVRRWSQRHPARATATAAIVLALLFGPSLYAWQETRARRTIQAQRDQLAQTNVALAVARDEARAESTRARVHFEALQRAVDTMLTRVGDETLRDIPQMEIVRSELLGEALEFYAGLCEQAPDDPRLRVETARLHVHVAEVQSLLGDLPAAAAELTTALDLFASAEPRDGLVVQQVAGTRTQLAMVRRLRGDLAGALASADEALAGWLEAKAHHDSEPVAVGLASARDERSQALADRGDLLGALGEMERLLAELDERSEVTSPSPELTGPWARALDRAAVWQVQLVYADPRAEDAAARLASACQRHRRAGELFQELLAADGSSTVLRLAAARNGDNLGIALQGVGAFEESLAAFRRSVEAYAALARDFPSSPRRRRELAHTRTNCATALGVLERWDEAAEEYAQAHMVWTALSSAAPADDELAIGLAQVLQGEAVVHLQLDRLDEAARLLLDARTAGARALAIRPVHPSYRRLQSKVYESLAEVELLRARHVDAARAARQLLEPALAPNDPALAACLIARCIPLAAADGDLDADERARLAAAYRDEAAALLAHELSIGRSAAALRADPILANQWSTAGASELLDELVARRD